MATQMDVLSSVCSCCPYESSRKIREGLNRSSEIQCAPREHFTWKATELSNQGFLRQENKVLKNH